MSAITTRVRGMAQWEPRAATIKLLDTVQSILVEYRSYLPMTVRQIFYRLVGAHGYDKTEQAYARLGEHLNRARRASLIEFDAIRDDGADIRTKIGWDNAADLIATWRNDADVPLDRQQGQPQRLLFMVEAAGMQPMVAGFTAPF